MSEGQDVRFSKPSGMSSSYWPPRNVSELWPQPLCRDLLSRHSSFICYSGFVDSPYPRVGCRLRCCLCVMDFGELRACEQTRRRAVTAAGCECGAALNCRCVLGLLHELLPEDVAPKGPYPSIAFKISWIREVFQLLGCPSLENQKT